MFLYHENYAKKNVIGQRGNGDCLEGVTFAGMVKEDFFFFPKEVMFELRPGDEKTATQRYRQEDFYVEETASTEPCKGNKFECSRDRKINVAST